ncbi:MAG TPA: cupin domain-containing protein [Dyella sp.]|uniref:cupin domain-containing protein n=1 Tax=Dyella sp. TaxID=1869338 RepID=UPI002F93A606
MFPRYPIVILFTSLFMMTAASAGAPPSSHEAVVQAFAHAIPNAQGKILTGLVVNYEPGQASLPHRHGQAFVVAYVLTGAIRSQVEGEQARVFHAGESWYENPGAHHTVSENASKTEPASLLAIFVADSDDKSLVTYDKPKAAP